MLSRINTSNSILHFCLYFVKTIAFVVLGLTISQVYRNTMLIILNNLIANYPLQDNFDRPPGLTIHAILPCRLHDTRVIGGGGSAVIVTKDRLIFRLD